MIEMGIFFWSKEYIIIRNSSKPHSISVGNTLEKNRTYPQDTICIRTSDGKVYNESQMTADEALLIASGLIKLVQIEIDEKRNKEKEVKA